VGTLTYLERMEAGVDGVGELVDLLTGSRARQPNTSNPEPTHVKEIVAVRP